MNEWQEIFFNNVSTYIGLINKVLSGKYAPEPLSKHIKILGGYAFNSSKYKTQGVPVIRISDFNNEVIDLSSVKYYQEYKIYQHVDSYTVYLNLFELLPFSQ